MSKFLEKLSKKIGTDRNPEEINREVDSRVSEVLDDHLDIVAAAHDSVHGDHHGSKPAI